MQGKRIVTGVLLLFVVVSVFTLVFRENRNQATTETADQSAAEQTAGDAVVVAHDEQKQPDIAAVKTVSTKESGVPSRSATLERTEVAPVVKAAAKQPLEPKVVVYYFHGNTRCITCKKIENFAKSAIESGFAAELKTGQIQYRAVNVEEPNNEHYVQDYQLVTRSVVLSRLRNDKQDSWKNLDRVWTLVRDPEAFQRYVVDETKQLLGGA